MMPIQLSSLISHALALNTDFQSDNQNFECKNKKVILKIWKALFGNLYWEQEREKSKRKVGLASLNEMLQ